MCVARSDSMLPVTSWYSQPEFLGLSKERPILDHYAKAHIHEIRRISPHLKSAGFQVKSTHNLIKSDVSTKTIQFDECRRGAMTLDFMKSAGFHG